MNIAFATIKQLQDKIKSKELSPIDLLDESIKRFKQYDAALGSALEIFDKDSVIKASSNQGLLHGIPGLLKDVIAQEGRELTCASKILQGYIATYDATATTRLKKQGAFLLGRANCDEFGMGSSNENSAYRKAVNPWDSSRVPGGSSGGSAVAVAAGLVPWALGAETGGSVRQPAAFCGIVGLKPTYGLVSRYGLVAYASSLDQIGVFSRTVYDNALIFSAIAGYDEHDASSLNVASKDYTKDLTGRIKDGLRIGVVENALNAPGIDGAIVAAIEEALAVMARMGARIKRISLPIMDYSAAVYFIVSRAEAASNLARFDGVRYGLRKKAATLPEMYLATRQEGFGNEVRRRILIGNYVLSAGHADAFYHNAKMVQRLLRRRMLDAFKESDLLVMPTHPAPAFEFGAFDADKLQMDLQDYFTCVANLAGIPALSVPCGMSAQGLPIGFQFVGPDLSEELLFATAHAYEQATPWHTMHPPGF
jgi:aspartyl-tRNA(Asn)/glutamyl-tRNA(Gln) amidotransferase subunit A